MACPGVVYALGRAKIIAVMNRGLNLSETVNLYPDDSLVMS